MGASRWSTAASAAVAVALLLVPPSARAEKGGADAGATATACDEQGVCALGELAPATASSTEPLPASAAEPAARAGERSTLLFFWTRGCPHCAQARQHIERLARERPELAIESVEIKADTESRERFSQALRGAGAPLAGVPAFVIGPRAVVGFVPGRTEAELEVLLAEARAQHPAAGDGVETKLFGRLSVERLGLPLFTIALGLLDGFNPCAMWVLVFLLAMLAGQRDRKRLALTAGTFVIASGAVYFAFMTAWLSLFVVIGLTRPVQLGLGAVALAMGAINVKDFFARGHGPSLSIPESAKPGIYARVRSVLHDHSLAGSLLGVALLAVFVNLIELLCTAGLPAIYTAVLARQELGAGARFAYLGLYNLAYVADDALMVTVAVMTLSRRRMGEATGRWLKLLSGAVMLALGALLLLRPDWLP